MVSIELSYVRQVFGIDLDDRRRSLGPKIDGASPTLCSAPAQSESYLAAGNYAEATRCASARLYFSSQRLQHSLSMGALDRFFRGSAA